MKKILIFVLLIVSNICLGQVVDVPSVNNHSEISNNFKAQLGSGNFVFDIPLFDLETVNPDFNFTGSLYYNAQAASSVFTAPGMHYKRGFSVDFLPTIHRKIERENTFWDESYFKVNSADISGGNKPDRTNDLFEFSVFGLRASFRLVYNGNNTIDIDLIDSNGYVDIAPVYTMTSGAGDAKIINLNGFTVKDNQGFSYQFLQVEESQIYQAQGTQSPFFSMSFFALENPVDFNTYKKAFLLTGVFDKYGRALVAYTYKDYETYLEYAGKTAVFDQKVIDEVIIDGKARLIFSTTQSFVTGVLITDHLDMIVHRVGFGPNGVSFYNIYDELEQQYIFQYYPATPSNSYINYYGNYLKNGSCLDNSLVYNNEIQNYTAALLKTIILPDKGKVDVEYEINTYYSGGGHRFNELNYDYVEVPVTPLSNGTYFVSFQGNGLSFSEAYYIKYTSQLYTDPLLVDEHGNPLAFYPGVYVTQGGSPYTIQTFLYENQCDYGEPMDMKAGNTTITIHPVNGFASHISNVKVYKKTLKPENQRVQYVFGPSVRVKKVTSTNHDNVPVSEKLYSYTVPGDDKRSSGKSGNLAWFTYTTIPSFTNYQAIPVFYQYVTIEETGKGKTVYELNSSSFVNSESSTAEIAFQPKNIWKYNDSGQLIEQVSNDFEYFTVSNDFTAKEKIRKISSTIKTYEGAHFNEINTEKVFDTVSLELVSSKITETANSQTFEEAYTYQKLGNAYYPTAVEKTKNNTALNQSTYAYQQNGYSQAYNLKTVSVAKESRPLEVEREITLYDGFGNVLEYKTKGGMVVSQIWGYNDSKLVAELKNVPYSSINNATITSIRTNSNAATYSESTLVDLLDGLRTIHSNGFVTTYTYRPPVGITSITDANGRKESYGYDTFSRLWRVYNHEGLVIREYEYNIKN